MSPIYLDYAATTPIDPRVAARMQACLENTFGNPASQHVLGQQAHALTETAREEIAAAISASSAEIVFTSGATESSNLALRGAAQLYQDKGRHIITTQTEHGATRETCEFLEKNGFSVTWLSPQADGFIPPAALAEAIRPDTILVSVIHVNNETGIVQDIENLATLTAERGILFHLDAAQVMGKILLNLQSLPVDLVSLSAHKAYGPKGIGALFLRQRPRVRVAAQMHGGGQEKGMRSGTLPVHQIVGMAEAFTLAVRHMEQDCRHARHLRTQFLEGLAGTGFILHGHPEKRVPHILNLRFPAHLAAELTAALPDLCFSAGSACHSKNSTPSAVLHAMGLSLKEAASAIRISFGRFTTEAEITQAAGLFSRVVSGQVIRTA